MAKVLIVDDSSFIKAALRKLLKESNMIDEIYEASNGIEALGILKNIDIDLITLDVKMPHMDGLELLKEIRKRRITTQVIMVSAYTTANASETIQALELGALDFVTKPRTYDEFYKIKDEILQKVESAIIKKQKMQKRFEGIRSLGEKGVVAIGISTGGPQTLGDIIPKLPKDYPYPILIAIHMPEAFTKSFAEHLSSKSRLQIKEAEEEEVLKPGIVYISKGGTNMVITGTPNAPKVNYKKDDSLIYIPSANLLFSSVASVFGQSACGIVMTGMGDDGSKGIVDIKNSGGITAAEDPQSAILWAMPENAIKTNAIDHILRKDEIPDFLMKIAQNI